MQSGEKQTFGSEVREGHLGGCYTGGDPATYHPKMWEFLVKEKKIQSVVDIGCGAGHSSKFFDKLGCDVIGVDGAFGAHENFQLPGQFILNDYEKGSAINDDNLALDGESLPETPFDLAWSCEFVEHVYEKYAKNFLTDFTRCKYVAMTYAEPGQGGYHHVNLQPESYWIEKMNEYGFDYDEEFTLKLRQLCIEDVEQHHNNDSVIPWTGDKVSNGYAFEGGHFGTKGLFFVKR